MTTTWSTWLYWTVVSGALVFSVLLTWQAFEHRRFARSRAKHRPRADRDRHLAMYVPCKGSDADLEANLRPLFEQDYASYEIVFVVESAEDPACATIRDVIQQYPGTPARLVVAGISTTSGQKVHNLLVATAELPQHVEALVFVDADVRPPRDWLRLLTARLGSVAVSTGYRCFIAKRASVPNWVLSSLNSSIVPIMFPGKHHLIWGGSWAITREVYESCGLREAWEGTLSDDLIATRVMAQLRQKVSAEPMCILPSPLDVSWSEMFSFVRRQLVIGRCYTVVHWYALVFGASVQQGVFWGSLGAVLIGLASGAEWTWQPALALALYYALHVWRAHLRHDASRHYLPYRQAELLGTWRFDLWLGPLAGLVGWLGLVSSAFTRRIVWKGITYEMRPGGMLRSITRPTLPTADADASPRPGTWGEAA